MKYKRSKYKLYHADCLEQMRVLAEEDVKVDLILTDPPYLTEYKTSHRKDKSHEFCSPIKNDDNPQVIRDSIPLMYDLLNGGGHYICSAMQTMWITSSKKWKNTSNLKTSSYG